MTYLTQAVNDMYPLLLRQPPRRKDLLRAASIGCNTLTTLLVDTDFQDHIQEISSRRIKDALDETDPLAPGQAARGWKANLLYEFPSFLGEIRKVMVEQNIPPGLVDTICRQARELRQPASSWNGDINDFLVMIERVRDDTCELVKDIRDYKVSRKEARRRLLPVLYLATGVTCVTFSTTLTLATLNFDFPRTLIALNYELANLANVLASGFVGLAIPAIPTLVFPQEKAKRVFSWMAAICLLLILTTVTGSVIYYAKFIASHTGDQKPATTLQTSKNTRLPFGKIYAYFYNNPKGSRNGTFDITPTDHPVFKESFPVIAFNPDPSTQECRKSTGINTTTRPFTDVLQNPDSSCTTIPAQDSSGHEAGLGNLFSFEAYFLTTITVPSKGVLVIQVSADDGWILSIGGNNNGGKPPIPQQTNVIIHPPAGYKSPIKNYAEMADNNVASSPKAFKITVNFSSAGTYPVEIDYTECHGGSLTLIMTNTFTPS